MDKELGEIYRDFKAWADQQTDEAIMARCQIILFNMRKLGREPDNIPLREQTMKNMADLQGYRASL